MRRTRKTNLLALALTNMILLVTLSSIPLSGATKGPREGSLTISFYADLGAAWTGLTTGAIDMVAGIGWSSALDLLDGDGLVNSTYYGQVIKNTNIVLAPVASANTYELDLNNNYTIWKYPGIRSPMNYTEMRQAVALLTDKDSIVNTVCGGLAQRIDQMIAAPYYGWANESLSYPYYPYEYDPAAAAAMLDSKFPQNTSQLNPYYDPSFPGSSPYLRNYPDDHPQKAYNILDPLIVCIRTDDTRVMNAGNQVENHLRAHGIQTTSITGTKEQLWRAFSDHDYHIYTGSWTVGRFPPVTLYGLYDSSNAFAGGRNYVTGSPLQNTHPKLDVLLNGCNYPTSYSQAVSACKLAAGYMTEICVNVPIWSDVSYCAYSKDLLGVVNMKGYGPINPYTFMNAYKASGTPITIGIVNPPLMMNTIYSGWIYDYICLDRMTLYGGIEVPPYNLAMDQPGFVKDWETTAWNDGGTTKTKVTMTFRSDCDFQQPSTGVTTEHVNASHYLFNAWLDYQVEDGWWSPSFRDLHHIVLTGPYSFEIYYDTYSYWNTYYCQGPLRPMDLWMAQGEDFINQTTETFVDPTTPGYISLSGDPVWIDYVTFDGTPLTKFTDYNIVKGSLYIYSTLGTGTLAVGYRYIASPTALRGYTPGGLPWSTIFEGAGMYYATWFTAGVGGSLVLNKNPSYYMETPPLGEIDFVRKSNGAYKVDIYDLVFAAGAFGSQGTGVPSSNWFPGADLAPQGGMIDIFDVVTVAGTSWGAEWDLPL